MLIDAWAAGLAAGGTPLGRPEGCVLLDGVLLITSDAETPKEGWAHNSLLRVGAGGTVERLVVGPPEAELCGPSFAPDGAMFLAVQHPHPDWGESALLCIWGG